MGFSFQPIAYCQSLIAALGGLMGLDVRLPIGAMFSFVGLLLTIYGAVKPIASQSVGININLIWGVVLLLFGIVMVVLGRQRARR